METLLQRILIVKVAKPLKLKERKMLKREEKLRLKPKRSDKAGTVSKVKILTLCEIMINYYLRCHTILSFKYIFIYSINPY